MEKEMIEKIFFLFLNMKKEMPYITFSEEKLKEEIEEKVGGLCWENIKLKRNVAGAVNSICNIILKKIRFYVIPEEMPSNMKSAYIKCCDFAEDKFLDLKIYFAYKIGFSKEILSKHIDIPIDDALLELTKVYKNGKERMLEIQLPFTSESDKSTLLREFISKIVSSVSSLNQIINTDLKQFDSKIKKHMDAIFEKNVELITNEFAEKYGLIA